MQAAGGFVTKNRGGVSECALMQTPAWLATVIAVDERALIMASCFVGPLSMRREIIVALARIR
jgi:hypothetical protein